MQRNETVTGHQTPPVVDGVGNAALVGVALAYILASLVSIGLTTGSTPIPILWLANGVALTALLLGGASAWPGVALGEVVGAVHQAVEGGAVRETEHVPDLVGEHLAAAAQHERLRAR